MKSKWYEKVIEFGVNLDKTEIALRANRTLIFTIVLIMAAIMLLGTAAAFFISVKSPERVMVPDVTGTELTEALQEMQVKQLYPKIQMRYSNSPEEKGTVLEQSPAGGTIVKAGRRIQLTVSQGAVIDRVENYVGMKIDDVRMQLQTLFAASTTPIIKLSDAPIYKTNAAEAGTVLEQNPAPNSALTGPVTLQLVVSSGPGGEEVNVPDITGISLNDVLLTISRTKLIFDFTVQSTQNEQEAGTVLAQKTPKERERLNAYSRIEAVIALPETVINDTVYGLIEENLPPYPYALPVELTAEPPDSAPYTVVTLQHIGGHFTVPYAVPRHSRLTLKVSGNPIKHYTAD